MRLPTNNVSPLMLLGCIVYVLALLSIYTFFAGIRARSRDTARTPAKPIRNNRGFRP
jgi:hypothetical protein